MRGDVIVKVDRNRLDGLVVREARLIVYTGMPRMPCSIVPRLVDARMVEIEGVTLTLIGVERDAAANNRVSEHVQVWRCKLLTGVGPDPGLQPSRSKPRRIMGLRDRLRGQSSPYCCNNLPSPAIRGTVDKADKVQT